MTDLRANNFRVEFRVIGLSDPVGPVIRTIPLARSVIVC